MAQISVIQGDITTMKVDAIVNAANTGLVGGGGVDGAIHRAAGPELDIACRKLGGCPTGEAKVTPGFRLPARFVIHTPGPIWRDGSFEEPKLLRACYVNSLKRAVENGCQTIAFPSISTGVYGYPLKAAAKIALTAIAQFDAPLQVTMVCFEDAAFSAYQAVLNELD
ncbi:O-acetyl-ADP-ribose deacetylase [Secundilactobacillus collinoides]|uniref:Appr-1-p processing protein n=2 Tax=Secundilactobacillus collinoides TaxID=33960 RepID=A0A0R2BHR4_SECCO|nr:O-acetyl-ADP-ribose deacetylase [Secundilactobacillus collinoides]KRM75091.1 Appr-1-p processing protein [Secundilactobacillus collinoides DSM 20515 = JCM 1123]KZL40110.1 macro domain-containing protein [Secundilactobacillus collinoides]